MNTEVLSLSIRLVALFVYRFINIITFEKKRVYINFLYLNSVYG